MPSAVGVDTSQPSSIPSSPPHAATSNSGISLQAALRDSIERIWHAIALGVEVERHRLQADQREEAALRLGAPRADDVDAADVRELDPRAVVRGAQPAGL